MKSLIESETLKTWRQQIWAHFGSRLETSETWPDDRIIDGFQFADPGQAFGRLPAVAAVVDQLGAGVFANADGAPLFTWPSPAGTEWVFPHTSHIDGYGTRWSPFMVGATTYLYDVESQGGGMGYWPGSHWTTHAYFREDPAIIDGRFQERKGWSWSDFENPAPQAPRQFTGRAGDVMFWHCFLVHGASINLRNNPRFAMFVRFPHQAQEDIKHEVPADLWKYWGI